MWTRLFLWVWIMQWSLFWVHQSGRHIDIFSNRDFLICCLRFDNYFSLSFLKHFKNELRHNDPVKTWVFRRKGLINEFPITAVQNRGGCHRFSFISIQLYNFGFLDFYLYLHLIDEFNITKELHSSNSYQLLMSYHSTIWPGTQIYLFTCIWRKTKTNRIILLIAILFLHLTISLILHNW